MATKSEKRPGPTLKAPHNRTIRVFDRAVLYARFELLKLILLLEAREKSWTQASLRGKSDPIPFNLTLSHIAAEFECDRASLSRQFTSLVKAKVFLGTDDPDFYLINKKPLTWIDANTGKPLFIGHKRERILQLEEEAKVYSRVGPGPQAVKLQPTEAVGPGPQAPTSGVGSSLQNSLTTVGPGPQAVKLQPTAKSSPHTPVERAQEDSVKESKKEETKTRASDVLNLDDEEPFNAPIPPMPKVDVPAVNNDSAEVAKVAAFADECFPMSDFGIQVRQHARFYPIAWLKRAIETAAGKRRASWPYIMAIVRGIEDDGGIQQRSFAANPAMAKKPDVTHLPPVVSYPRKTVGASGPALPPVSTTMFKRKNPPGTAERLRQEKAEAERKRLESGSSAEPEQGKGEPPRADPGSLF
ncbi:hypothetical protein [Singulisphaera sp. PoT]|uniref:hypothetical protein n=1 Tax=Singulisphaera sp. PoT TaxID=3411797 RepID=UPI003BF4F0EC